MKILILIFFFFSFTFTQSKDSNLFEENLDNINIDSNISLLKNETPLVEEVPSVEEITIPTTIKIPLTNEINEEEPEGKSVEDGDFSIPNIFRSLLISYPDVVTKVKKADNPYHPDLAIRVRDKIFYNVQGRFLPEEERDHWKKYSSNTFYDYAKSIPDPLQRTKKEIQLMKKQGSKNYRKRKKSTYPGFNEALYGMKSLSDTNTQIIKARFLGKQVLVHQFSYKPLMKVQEEIYKLTNTHPEVVQFLREGDTVYSFFWRNIANSKGRSLHSYGIAVDVLKEGSTDAVYWLWRQNQKIDWIREPISVRWNPPLTVVEIFEKHGFVWGGKWNFYDTMHFEYRPDLLLLNGYEVIFVR